MREIPIVTKVMVLGDETPLYDVSVNLGDLRGPEGNAWSIMGSVTNAMRNSVRGASAEDRADMERAILNYRDEAKSGDYKHLLKVTGQYVEAIITGIPEQYADFDED